MPPRIAPGGGAGSGPQIASHVQTVGVRRPAFGTAGRAITVSTNHFEVKIPKNVIHHYDVVISPSEQKLPARLNLDLITHLQEVVAPDVFTPRGAYDGRKNLFAASELRLSGVDDKRQAFQEFMVSLPRADGAQGQPKAYKIRVTKVAQINTEVLHRYLAGNQSHDNAILTAITALNVVIRMAPTLRYPFNVRSFFTDRETKDIGMGLILWRGYFQSVRPGGNRMFINVDISTGTMYKHGPLVNLCLEHLGRQNPQQLTVQGGLTERDRYRLQRFIAGIRVYTAQKQGEPPLKIPRVIKKLTLQGAAQMQFTLREGGTMTVAQYFQQTYRKVLSFPNLPCVEVGSGALIPIELCTVPAGQIMRKQVPPEKTKDVLDFATKEPSARLQSIRAGLQVLDYGRSEYVRQFGMVVNESSEIKLPARVLNPPTLKYGGGGRQAVIQPKNGAWNMLDKRFYRAASVAPGWIVVVYERPQRFGQQFVEGVIQGLRKGASEVGMTGFDAQPLIKYLNAQGRVDQHMREIGAEFMRGSGNKAPKLIVAVLPEGATDVYTAIKHFGDCVVGCATQCLKSLKCSRAKPQYYANVCLKINVKLGGINCVPDAPSVPVLTDPSNPTIVLGADVVHPAPGSEGRPSFTSLVGNVDSENSKYIATTHVQESRVEMIADLQEMTAWILDKYRAYRKGVEQKTAPPKRVIFYRDGVSEGQFRQVLDEEVPRIKAAFAAAGLTGPNTPKLTVIVVGKRHHVRFFPDAKERDKSGNCPAGTVVDRELTHPHEFDFYLQSHGGLLGTSRPAHYSVLLDENKFAPDAIQLLSFALCHVYARSTRSVSIPAPVYYADIVCARAKNHFDPNGTIGISDSQTMDQQGASGTRGNPTIAAFKQAFKQPHPTASTLMYFS